MLKFNDGVQIDTDGELRIKKLIDGYYVLGQGVCIPCNDREEAEETLQDLREVKEI